MRLPIKTQLREGAVIAAAGVVVAAAPVAWYPRVWPDRAGDDISAGGWLFLFAFSLAPFAIVAFLRATGLMRRVAGMLAALVVAAIVVFGQVAGLNPNDPSSTAPVALVIAPMNAGLVALAIWGADRLLEALISSWSGRRSRPPA